MALLNRFSKLNDRAETGIFTFIVTKSVTRDFHRDATTKDFCFGYHRWAISFQRPTEKVLGVHLLLRNPSPNTACVVDFTLSLLNRQHFSKNEVYTKRQAKFTITNSMQGVSRWIQMSDLIDKHFSNEAGEFLFELSLSNMTTIFECDIQLNPSTLTQYKTMLKSGPGATSGCQQAAASGPASGQRAARSARSGSELINLETNYFTFGAFEWSLTVVPLVVAASPLASQQHQDCSSTTSSSSSNNNLLAPSHKQPSSRLKGKPATAPPPSTTSNPNVNLEPVCRVYLNRLNGSESLCRVKYRVILGHHQAGGQQSAEFVDSKVLDQISDSSGHIRGYQFKNTNVLKLISLKAAASGANQASGTGSAGLHSTNSKHSGQQPGGNGSASLDLRVHIEMFCANTISECRVQVDRTKQQQQAGESQLSNCQDRNKQAWCVEADCEESDTVRLKLFFMDLQSVPRNHIRYISWVAYVVRRDTKTGALRESTAVKNSPHCNYYLQDGMDMGTIMNTEISVKELNNLPSYLEAGHLTVHIEWVDSLLLFSHLYNNYDALAIIQRHQIGRELEALQAAFMRLETKYNDLLNSTSPGLLRQRAGQDAGLESLEDEEDYSLDESQPSSPSLIELHQQYLSRKQPQAPPPAPQRDDIPAPQRKPLPQTTAFAISHDDRLKYSSSTPPDGLLVQQTKQQQQQPPPPPGHLRRRQLPPEPIDFKQPNPQTSSLDQRRNSQASYQQIRAMSAAATFELATSYDQQQTTSLRKQFTTPGGSINEHRRRSMQQQQHCQLGESDAGLSSQPLNQPEAGQVTGELNAPPRFQPTHNMVAAATAANSVAQLQPDFLYQQSYQLSDQIYLNQPMAGYNPSMQRQQEHQHLYESAPDDKRAFVTSMIGPSSANIEAEMETLYLNAANSQLAAESSTRYNLDDFYDDQRRLQLLHHSLPIQEARRDSSQDYQNAIPVQPIKADPRGASRASPPEMLTRFPSFQLPVSTDRNLPISGIGGVEPNFKHFGHGQH